MKEQLEASAREAGRSVNAEIVHRLGISLHSKRAEEVFTKAATFGMLEMMQDPQLHDAAMALWADMRKKLPLDALESTAARIVETIGLTSKGAHPWAGEGPTRNAPTRPRPAKKG
jgi:hypothetical protein